MTSLGLTPLPLPLQLQYSSSLKPPLLLKPSSSSFFFFSSNQKLKLYRCQRKIRRGLACKAELSHDAPFAVAIGACVLSSLFFPVTGAPDEDDGDSAIDSTDSRLAVMSIVSFIPYFNWLSWVFAWLDTGERRYVVYSLVYLVPYFRSNLSLSPEESWLPIASIILGIIHVQLEMSIKNGDIQGFQLFSEASKRVSSSRQKDSFKVSRKTAEEGRKNEQNNLPSADEQSRNKLRGWGVPKEPLRNSEHEDKDEDEGRKH